MTRAKLLVGCLFGLITPIFADYSPSEGFFAIERQNIRASIRHIEKGGIGYNHGYSTLEAFFAPDPRYVKLMPFFDLRGHVFNNGKIAANAGIGIRGLAGCGSIYGLNMYYDYRDIQRTTYKQIGLGFERLGSRWDFRINGYMPTQMKIRECIPAQFVGFAGHRLIVRQQYNFVMRGFNAEFGYHFLRRKSVDLYGAAGPYYFTGKNGPHIWGGKLRFGCRFKYGTIELNNSYDKMFRNRFQCLLTFTLPFGGGTKPNGNDECDSCDMRDVLAFRMTQPVVRQEIIVQGYKKCCSAAINPATGLPYTFIFVDNTSHSEGTFRSPYPTLALAQENSQPGDILYVFPGDGTTNGMNTGIVLQNNQKFWGSGVQHALATKQGAIAIPALSETAPIMTNINDADGITLAPNNEVSGFTITDVPENSIFGTNLNNITISDCTIDNTTFLDHIHLEFSGGPGTASLKNITLTDSANDAIAISSTGLSLACTVQDCVMQNNVRYPITLTANQAAVNVTDNTITNNGNGNNFVFNDASTVTISGNTMKNTTSTSDVPISISAAASPVAATIKNNIIQDNVAGGINFTLNNTNPAQLTVANNSIISNGFGSSAGNASTVVMSPNNTTLGNSYLTLTGNSISDNRDGALYCFQGGFNNFEVNATGNTITGNGGGALSFANNMNTFVLNAANNSIVNGGNHAITTSGSVTIVNADMAISNNQITGNTGQASGIALSHLGTNLAMAATHNTVSNNEGTGILLYHGSAIDTVSVNIARNTISNNQNLGSNAAGGIDLEQYTNLSATLTNNTLSNNATRDVYVNSTEPTPSVCLTMNGNTSDMGYTLDSGTGTFNLAPCNVDAVNTGVITLVGTITPVQSCPAAVVCP